VIDLPHSFDPAGASFAERRSCTAGGRERGIDPRGEIKLCLEDIVIVVQFNSKNMGKSTSQQLHFKYHPLIPLTNQTSVTLLILKSKERKTPGTTKKKHQWRSTNYICAKGFIFQMVVPATYPPTTAKKNPAQ